MRIKDLNNRLADKLRSRTAASAVQPVALRPQRLSEFVGQDEAVGQLRLLTDAAKMRGEPVCHLLIDGPGGLGKTTLAGMIATEMGAPLFATTAPTLGPETLGKILSTSAPGMVVFIDEFHGLGKTTSELLYGAMEDGTFDMPTPVGPEKRRCKPFTLVAATTRPGDLSESMKDRFGHIVELTYYQDRDMATVAQRSSKVLGLRLAKDASADVADRSRGIPRVLNSYLARIRDYVMVNHPDLWHPDGGLVGMDVTDAAFTAFGVDGLGLTERDRAYLISLVVDFRGGPVGEENLAIRLGMDGRTVRTDIEPYLMRLGLVARANRGRIAQEAAREYVSELLGE